MLLCRLVSFAFLVALLGCSRPSEVYSVEFFDGTAQVLATGTITLPSVPPREGMIRGSYSLQFHPPRKRDKAADCFLRLLVPRERGEVVLHLDAENACAPREYNFMPGQAYANIFLCAPATDAARVQATWRYEVDEGSGTGGIATLQKRK